MFVETNRKSLATRAKVNGGGVCALFERGFAGVPPFCGADLPPTTGGEGSWSREAKSDSAQTKSGSHQGALVNTGAADDG